MRAFTIDEQRYLDELASQLNQVSQGKKGELISRAAAFLQCSNDRIYRGLKEVGWTSGRRRRNNKGQSCVSHDEAQAVSNIIVESARANGKRLLSTETAIEIAVENGVIDSNASSSTYLRVMKENGCHPDQLTKPTPHSEIRSLHPNHVWQFDVSVCVLYYLDKGGMSVMDEKKFYKNKPENVARISNKRVLRYLVTDHNTGSFYVQYYQGSGENQEILFDFLMESFTKREHPQDPFHGVPFLMVWDAGSANQSYLIKNLLDRLTVKHWAHTPGQPRSKGQVEKTHDLIERDFEGRLFMMNIQNIDELNQKAHIWMRKKNGKDIHTRTKTTRYGLWQTIKQEQLRICPPREICEQLLRTKPEPRQVKGNLVVSYAVKGYEAQTYSVEHVPGIRVGETVDVCVNPYQAPNIFVITEDSEGNEILHECTPIERDAAGFPVDAPVFGESYQSKPDTNTDTQRKQMAKEAYEVETLEEVDKARAKHSPAFGGKVDPISYLEDQTVADYMKRRGTELELPQSISTELKPLSHIEALKWLRLKLERAVTKTESQRIREQYPDGIPEEHLEVLLSELSGETISTQGNEARELYG
jgi:hypothetical protein